MLTDRLLRLENFVLEHVVLELGAIRCTLTEAAKSFPADVEPTASQTEILLLRLAALEEQARDICDEAAILDMQPHPHAHEASSAPPEAHLTAAEPAPAEPADEGITQTASAGAEDESDALAGPTEAPHPSPQAEPPGDDADAAEPITAIEAAMAAVARKAPQGPHAASQPHTDDNAPPPVAADTLAASADMAPSLPSEPAAQPAGSEGDEAAEEDIIASAADTFAQTEGGSDADTGPGAPADRAPSETAEAEASAGPPAEPGTSVEAEDTARLLALVAELSHEVERLDSETMPARTASAAPSQGSSPLILRSPI